MKMKAKVLLDGASGTYGPEALKVIGKAFDDAWAEIGPTFAKAGMQPEAARLTLANAILSAATADSRDPDELKNMGLKAMAHTYRLPGAT
jgi:hypothetical protein